MHKHGDMNLVPKVTSKAVQGDMHLQTHASEMDKEELGLMSSRATVSEKQTKRLQSDGVRHQTLTSGLYVHTHTGTLNPAHMHVHTKKHCM